MRGSTLCLLLLAAPYVASCNTPKWRYQSAVIEQAGDTICIKINDNKESRRSPPTIRGLTVGEQHSDRYEELWKAFFIQDGTPRPTVTPDECIPFAQIKGFPQLEAHKAYVLSITGDAGNEVRHYKARFCMIERDGSLRVHQVLFDRQRKAWAWEVCGIPQALP